MNDDETAAREIADPTVRQSAITSHSIGFPELARLLESLPPDADVDDYSRAAIEDNALGLATESGRRWRFATLRRLYLLRQDSILFRSLRDLWADEPEARPLLAVLCAMATDTVLRASSTVIEQTSVGERIGAGDFAAAIESYYPGAYAPTTLKKTASNAYASWQQSGHLDMASGGKKLRIQANCYASDVAYALLLGHLQGHRGEALFETIWVRILDQPKSILNELAFGASQRGMIEFRNAGGVVEVSFTELLRPRR